MNVGNSVAPVRFLLFGAILVVATIAAGALGALPTLALLIGFDVAAIVFLCTVIPLLNDDAPTMRRTAERNDANRAGLLAINVVLLLVLLVAIGRLIMAPQTLDWTDVTLIVVTLVLAWLFANTVFALHYAHLFYLRLEGRDRGGIEVPDMREPGYWDFFYFSFTLGMTFQTSDVTITGAHMRKIVLLHSMAAFLFNMGILAFAVNALGGL